MKKQKLLVPLATLFLLTGCIADENTDSEDSGASQEAISYEDIKPADNVDTYAVEKVNQLFTQPTSLQEQREDAIEQCMKERGLSYNKQAISVASYDVRNYMLPKPLKLDEARVYGYKTNQDINLESQPFGGSADASQELTGSSTAEAVSVDGITGKIQSDGCIAEAYREVYGSAEAGILLEAGGLSLPIPYLNAAHMDQRMIDLDEQWSECMREDFSLEFENPDFTNNSADTGTIEIAVADATCREKLNYENEVLKTMNSYLTVFLEDNENIIAQVNSVKSSF